MMFVGITWLAALALVVLTTGSPSPAGRHDALEQLGARLFVEPLLSGDGAITCSSCHDAGRAFTDGQVMALGRGGAVIGRNTPTLLGLQSAEVFGWADPRLTSLEAAIKRPLCAPGELGACLHIPLVEGRLRADPELNALARRAFGDALRWQHITPALSAYILSLRAPETPYDRFLAGDASALTPLAERGRVLFGELGCNACHSGPRLGGASYHNLGLYNVQGRYPEDIPAVRRAGLELVTGDPGDNGRFRVPSLRYVSQTGPYFHDGSAATLADVLTVYEDGGRLIADGPWAGDGRANLNKTDVLVPVVLSPADKDALIAFLESL
jgi:cytochrome c peroxidase